MTMTLDRERRITYFGKTTWRSEGKRFGIRLADRRSHMYIIGKTGTGKSTLLKTMILQDMDHGHGLALLDPHGDSQQKSCRGSAVFPTRVTSIPHPHFDVKRFKITRFCPGIPPGFSRQPGPAFF